MIGLVEMQCYLLAATSGHRQGWRWSGTGYVVLIAWKWTGGHSYYEDGRGSWLSQLDSVCCRSTRLANHQREGVQNQLPWPSHEQDVSLMSEFGQTHLSQFDY